MLGDGVALESIVVCLSFIRILAELSSGDMTMASLSRMLKYSSGFTVPSVTFGVLERLVAGLMRVASGLRVNL